MSEREQKLCVGKTPLHQIRNRNEARVAQIMPSLFAELNLELDSIDIQDVFALALNKLPAALRPGDGHRARGTGR